MNEIPGINLLPESIRGYALLFVAFFPYLTRAWHALSSGGGLVGVKNAILFGTNTPSQATSSNGSASKLPLIALLLVLPLAFSITGCKSSPPTVTYQATASTAVTVDTTMRLWGAYVAASHPGIKAESAVKAAYEKYRASMLMACDLGAIYAATSVTNATGAAQAKAAVDQAISNAANELADLQNLIRTFGVKF